MITQEIIKNYMDNIYQRIHRIEKATELILDNEDCYYKIKQKVEIAPIHGKNMVILPPIEEVFSASITNED